jgi:hypothetical protein
MNFLGTRGRSNERGTSQRNSVGDFPFQGMTTATLRATWPPCRGTGAGTPWLRLAASEAAAACARTVAAIASSFQSSSSSSSSSSSDGSDSSTFQEEGPPLRYARAKRGIAHVDGLTPEMETPSAQRHKVNSRGSV